MTDEEAKRLGYITVDYTVIPSLHTPVPPQSANTVPSWALFFVVVPCMAIGFSLGGIIGMLVGMSLSFSLLGVFYGK